MGGVGGSLFYASRGGGLLKLTNCFAHSRQNAITPVSRPSQPRGIMNKVYSFN